MEEAESLGCLFPEGSAVLISTVGKKLHLIKEIEADE
jgi:hypothetical protein